MGAKQSKRSVDISGKEAEGGEVAAAGAGGEGRVEALADHDALKPQLNGGAPHIVEPSEKEKQLDSGTPENEKDATTEKEEKDQDNETVKEKEAVPVTNGEAETNGESTPTPTPDEGKKPKKEKVKKKWSLRSISFSRKDKPKQEKKQKDEEAKTNGDTEKVPEEAAEATPEVAAVTEVAEEAKSTEETKDEKTPETPVTEPLTNGSSTPESPKEAVSPPEETKPEDLPVNGLSLQETEAPKPEESKPEESKPEEPAPEPETAEIPVTKEVCVDISLESPPPLPACPPPSGAASLAASTMAPSLPEPTLPAPEVTLPETATMAPSLPELTLPETATVAPTLSEPDLPAPEPATSPAPPQANIAPPTNPLNDTVTPNDTTQTEPELPPPINEIAQQIPETIVEEIETKAELHTEVPLPVEEIPLPVENNVDPELDLKVEVEEQMIDDKLAEGDQPDATKDDSSKQIDEVSELKSEPTVPIDDVIPEPEPELELVDTSEDLPPPPPLEEDLSIPSEVVELVIDADIHEKTDIIPENGDSNHISEKTNGLEAEILNGNSDTEQENIKNKTKIAIDNILETIECNGNTQGIIEEIVLSKNCEKTEAAAPSPPPPAQPQPAQPAISQEPIAVSDKLANLIPEVPVVPELNTETLVETSSDVAVAN